MVIMGSSVPGRVSYCRPAWRKGMISTIRLVSTIELLVCQRLTPLVIKIWPSGWAWHTGGALPHYLQMILGVYATLGVFLLLASRNPLAHVSLIRFTVWSSVVHAGIMGVQALAHPDHRGHLWGDVPTLFLVAAVLAFLMPRGAAAKSAS